MTFTTQPAMRPRRVGRGLRVLMGGVVLLVGLGFIAHMFWGRMWDEEPPSTGLTIRPAQARLDRYALPPPPEPEVEKASLPVAKTPEKPEPMQPEPRLQRVQEADAPKPIRLGEVSWNIAAIEVARPEFHDGRLPMQWPGCALRPGPSKIPALLETAIFSEQGGQVIARVTSAVYSPDGGYQNKPLVPAGSFVTGYVEREKPLSFAQRRIGVVWTQMQHSQGFGDPHVTQINFGEGTRAASADGSGGIGGRVEVDWGSVIATAFLATIFNVAQRPSGDNIILDESGRTVGRIGEDIVERTLDAEPKILIDAGTQVWVMVQKTIRVC